MYSCMHVYAYVGVVFRYETLGGGPVPPMGVWSAKGVRCLPKSSKKLLYNIGIISKKSVSGLKFLDN